jgi:hypothetical protein
MFPNPCYAGEEIVFRITGISHGKVHLTVRRAGDDAELMNLLCETREDAHV